MALSRAVLLGAVAAIAVPYALRDESGLLGEFVERGAAGFAVAGVHLHWSWPLFCIVTLFAWGFLAWSNR